MLQAKQVELKNWKDIEVYEEIKDQGQKVISTRWMITEKICEGQKEAKARLVSRGFEDEDQVPKDSPTAAKSTLRTVLAITAMKVELLRQLILRQPFFKVIQLIVMYIFCHHQKQDKMELYGNWKRQFMAWTMHLVSGISV